MKSKNLIFTFLGQALSKQAMKRIVAGSGDSELALGSPCTGNVQCWTNHCNDCSDSTTGKCCVLADDDGQ